MKSKLIINIKKLISILLFTSLISSILPSNLLNNTVFASNNIYYGITSFEEMKEAIKKAHNDDTILLYNDITIPDNDDYIIINKDITIKSLKNTYKVKSQSSKSKFLDICNNCTVDLENIIIDLSQNDIANQYNEPIKVSPDSKLNIHPDALLVNCGTNKSDILDNNATNIDDLNLTNISESDEVDNNDDLDLTNISESDEVDFELKGEGYSNYEGKDITISMYPNGQTFYKIKNETEEKYLTEDDYIIYEYTDDDGRIAWDVTVKKEYLETLPPQGNPYIIHIYTRPFPEEAPEYIEQHAESITVWVHPKNNQPDNNAQFNNLKAEYTYGEDPSTISFTGGAGDGNVTYISSDESVAKIDESTGELTIVGTGTFQIIATKAANYCYNSLNVKSKEITVNPRELTLENIKIKDKVWDGANNAEFDGVPTLKGVINGDDVKLIGSPKFSNTGLGNNILIDFSDLSISGDKSSNYRLTLPKNNIYANIISNDINDTSSSDSDDIQLNIPSNSKDNKLTVVNPPDLIKDNKLAFVTPPDLIKDNKLKTTNPTNNIQQDMNYDSDNSDDSTQPDSDEITTDDDQDEIFEAEDSKTGIQVYAPKGVFPKWSRLIVREMYPNTNEYDNAYNNLDENIKRKIEHIRLYEIYVVNQDGEVIQPNISKGLVTVRVPIPNDYDLADLQIYRIKQDSDDNFKTNIVNINNKSYCEFQTNHFSTYTIIDEKTTNDIILSILPYLILLLTLILMSLFILILKKRDKDENKYKEEQQ